MPDSLKEWCAERSMPAYRAQQILEWVYEKGAAGPAEMTNLSKLDRETLTREMVFESGATVAQQDGSDGTRKILVEWNEYGKDAPKSSLPVLGQCGDRHRDTGPERRKVR